MIKLLIVDDSALMRRQLSMLFAAAGGYEVRLARNGLEAVEENRRFQPDVVTLDINMPEMDGITALSLIMAERPVPVVMVSSLTEKGALATFEALNLGAVDYVAKPGGTISLSLEVVKADLLAKVKAAARARVTPGRPPLRNLTPQAVATRAAATREHKAAAALAPRARAGDGLVIVGVSTGGPRAVEEMLSGLPGDFPLPILVAQHMPGSFTAPFAARLNDACALNVVEASRPMPVEPGTVYIGRGGADMVVTRRGNVLTVLPRPEAAEFLWHPSAELLARSVLEHANLAHVIGVMLTGMGYDGADGFAELKRRGARTIAESQDTAVVFGMPAELIERGGASVVLPLDRVAAQLRVWADRR